MSCRKEGSKHHVLFTPQKPSTSQLAQCCITSYRGHHRVPAGMHPLRDGLQTDAEAGNCTLRSLIERLKSWQIRRYQRLFKHGQGRGYTPRIDFCFLNLLWSEREPQRNLGLIRERFVSMVEDKGKWLESKARQHLKTSLSYPNSWSAIFFNLFPFQKGLEHFNQI